MIGKMYLLLLPFFCLSLNAQSHADDILGKWMAVDHSVLVKVDRHNNEYRAKILWFDVKLGSGIPLHLRLDKENPDPKLRSRKIIGMEILEGLQYNQQSHTWEHGRIYDASTGRHWDSSAKITADGILQVRGYWKFKWIGKSMSFKKMK